MALDVLYTKKEKEKISKIFDETDKCNLINKIGLLDELSFQVFGYAKIGSLQRKERPSRDLYAFNCTKHGLQVTITTGQPDKIQCKKCLLEHNTEMEEAHSRIVDDKEKLREKAEKTKKDLSKFRTSNQNSK